MSGNTFGKLFTLTTCGESHGPALMAIVDGCPAGLELSVDDIQPELDRRKPGTSRHTSQRRESDSVQILSGVFEGKTTGTPIGLLIENRDQRTKDYAELADRFRPGHADYTYHHKYGIRDYRGGGRSSARETAMRVAAGAIAKKFLRAKGISFRACLQQVGHIHCDVVDWELVNQNPLFCGDAAQIPVIADYLQQLRREGDSIGARVYVEALGVPVGLGEPVFDKLDAAIAAALMSINAVKGVEIGSGFASSSQRGSEHRDEITPQGFLSNNAGGILGGISSGQTLSASIALKPTPSIRIPGKTIDVNGNACEIITEGRHDPCVGIRAVPIAEAMLALVVMDYWLWRRAEQGG